MTEEAKVGVRVYEEALPEEVVVTLPDTIASLLYSFVDSSMKKDYYWNKTYTKIFPNGNYWVVGMYRVGDDYVPFVRFSAPGRFLEIVYERPTVKFTANFALERREFTLEDLRRIVLKGVRLERKIPLYVILAKLLRYFNKMKKELNISV